VRRKRSEDGERRRVDQDIIDDKAILEAEVMVKKVRVKRGRRDTSAVQGFTDPLFDKQWHLYNSEFNGKDLNVLPVWQQNITGQGVVVAILDDGVEHSHPDIAPNYDVYASWDFIDNDNDSRPVSSSKDDNNHGTRRAGEVAAAKNNYCGVGVAYDARIAGVRMLTDEVEDATEAEALEYMRDYIDIYSSSWGPVDNGEKVDGPGLLVKTAFEEGAKYGRNGKGSIYVWASGNGGVNRDNCNCDGYCSSIYTISISATNEQGIAPYYAEDCTATLAAAYSSGKNTDRRIVTTDLHSQCTEEHSGTSAAAPLAAGVIALAVSANQNLTWRDVQHIIVQTSYHLDTTQCKMNGANRCVNNKIGYGILNSAAIVEQAKSWDTVSEQHVCRITDPPNKAETHQIKSGQRLYVEIYTNACAGLSTEVSQLEHVQAILTISHSQRGALRIDLTSPSGTKSSLLTERPSDKSKNGFDRWSFLTVHMWGEQAVGKWVLTIDTTAGTGMLSYFELVFYGTSSTQCKDCTYCRYNTLTIPGGKSQCVTQCPLGYYTLDNTCLECDSSCYTCLDQTTCTACHSGHFLLYEQNTCVPSCPSTHEVQKSAVNSNVCIAIPAKQWYTRDSTYVIMVAVCLIIILTVVLGVSVHHYRKHNKRVPRSIRAYPVTKPGLQSHTQSQPDYPKQGANVTEYPPVQGARVPSIVPVDI